MIYVTHDQVEAMTMGDRVAVLRDGHLQQVAPPQVLYDDPDNLFVAAFIGSPSMNLLEGSIAKEGDRTVVVLGEHRLPVPDSLLSERPGLAGYAGRDVVVGIRPEHLSDASLTTARSEDGRLTAHVELRESLGSEVLAHLHVAVKPALTEETRVAVADVDDAAIESLERQADEGRSMVVASFDARSGVRVGDRVEVVVATDRLHFFDPDTGLSIRR
jgi:multiple sugar transport system ATP-binding protein